MSVFSDSSPIIIKKRKGNSIEPFKSIEERILVLENGFGVLDELPDKFTKVTIDDMVEINTEFANSNIIKHENEYIVNYNRGFIYFHKNKIKQEIIVKYKGTGVVLYPASRIYDTGNTNIVTTIQQMIDGGRDAIETYSNISNAIKVGNETYVKLSTTIDNANEINNTLNTTIIEAKDIDLILKETIKSATNINNTLSGSIENGTNKIQEIDNKIIDVNKRVSEINTEEAIRNDNEKTRESNETSRMDNEDTRISSENQRIENEKNRQSKESDRINSEIKRIEEFNEIKENTSNINDNQELEIKKISDLNTNINKKEAKREENESKRIENENSRQESFTNTQNELKTINTNISTCEEYSSKKQYKKLNRVTFKGSSYECLKDCINIEPNATNKEFWICIAQRGQDGNGSGNMHSDIYDKNNDGVVDRADKSNDSDRLGGKNASEYLLKTDKVENVTIKPFKNTITLTKESNICVIGLTEFNKDIDELLVYQNGVYIEKTKDYIITEDGLNIQKVNGNWNNSTVFNFVMYKGVKNKVSYEDGSLILDGSIVLTKLNSTIQSKINSIDSKLNQEDKKEIEDKMEILSNQQNTDINRIDDLNKNTKIAVENTITVERNSIGLNPLSNLNYVGGDTFQANKPIMIDNGISKQNYNSEIEIVNNKNIKYLPIKDKVIENNNSIGNTSQITKELIDNLKSNSKDINIVNSINYLYKNGGNGTGKVKLGEVKNLIAKSNDEGTSINLTWQNPIANEYMRTEIYIDTKDLTSLDYDYCSKNCTKIVNDKVITFDYKCNKNTTYYFKAFAIYSILGVINSSDGTITNTTSVDKISPNKITNIQFKAENKKITLTWTNPIDEDFAGVKILKKEDSCPIDINDGDIIFNNNLNNFIDTNVINDTTYYYRFFPYDDSDNYNIETGQQIQAIPQAYKEYGVKWNKSSDTVTRLGNAIGLTAITGGKNDFNNLIPWRKIKRCNLSDEGNVNAYSNEPNYKTDGSNGNCMVQIPKFWFKIINIDDNNIEFWICDGAKEGYEVHPAFFRDREHLTDNNSGIAKEVDYRYHHTYLPYQNGDKLISKSNVSPTVDITIGQARDYAKNNGNGWGLVDFNLRSAIQLLYLVEYANFDSQTAIGRGYVDSNSGKINTGGTNQYGNNSFGETTGHKQMSYRGIEDLWGNCYYWIDGFYCDNNHDIHIGNKGFNDSGENYSVIYKTGFSSNKSGYVSNIFSDKNTGFVGNEYVGSNNSKLFDCGRLYGGYLPVAGGDWSSGSDAGAFGFNCYFSASESNSRVACSLAF